MNGICVANCQECELLKSKQCEGCTQTNGCPFGKKCWIARYIESGGEASFQSFEKELIDEINALGIEGMPTIDTLYPLHGDYVNLEYPMPNGEKGKLLKDEEAYLGTHVECDYNTDEEKSCFGIVANMSFILVAEYGEGGTHPEIVLFKRR